MIFIAAGAAVLAVLVWAGRRSASLNNELRIASALLAALAAAGAVVAGLRGSWIVSLGMVALSAYLGRTASVRSQATRRRPAEGPPMSLTQARSILGVGPEATRDDIQAAYRRLIARAHPDVGGSGGLAAQLNAARDRLLG